MVRALAPDIVFADKPMANLDSATGHDLIGMLRDRNRTTGTTFLIASHHPAVIDAANLCIRRKDGQVTDVIRCGDSAEVVGAATISRSQQTSKENDP